MEYQSNSSNLFKKYSKKPSGLRKEAGTEVNKPVKEILEYQQRYKSAPPDKDKEIETKKQSKVIVHIGGMQHMLSLDDHDGEPYIRAVAEHADKIINQIMQDTPGLNMMSVLILSVVNAVDEAFKAERKGNSFDSKVEQTEYELKSLKSEYIKQREINWELKKEVIRLKELMQSQNDEVEENSIGEDAEMLPLEEMIFKFSESEDMDE